MFFGDSVFDIFTIWYVGAVSLSALLTNNLG
jgi:hypothetical protein